MQREARAVRLETLKTAAMHELWLMAFGDDSRRRGVSGGGGFSADEMRAIEVRRRACVSLLQLKPSSAVQGARDSSIDIPSPRFFDDGVRNHRRDTCGIDSSDELRVTNYESKKDNAARLAATRPTGREARRDHELQASDESEADHARKLEQVQQHVRSINQDIRARAEFAKSDELDFDAIAALAGDARDSHHDKHPVGGLETCRYQKQDQSDLLQGSDRNADDAHPP